MKILKRVIPILLALALIIGTSVPVLAATSATVSITATPTYIAMTNSESTWAIGTVAESTTYWWTADGNIPDPTSPLDAADMKSTITNTGSVTEDIDIKVDAFTGGEGWDISTDDSPGEDEVSIEAAVTGGDTAAMVQVVTTDTELTSSLASSGTIKMCMSLETGTFTDGDEKTGVVTLTATAS